MAIQGDLPFRQKLSEAIFGGLSGDQMRSNILSGVDLNKDNKFDISEAQATAANIKLRMEQTTNPEEKAVLANIKNIPSEALLQRFQATGLKVSIEAIRAMKKDLGAQDDDVVTANATGQGNGSAATGQSNQRALPGQEEDKGKGRGQEKNKDIITMFMEFLASMFNMNQEEKDHTKTDVAAKSSGGTSVSTDQAQASAENVTGKKVGDLDPSVLAQASKERDVLRKMEAGTYANVNMNEVQVAAGANKQHDNKAGQATI